MNVQEMICNCHFFLKAELKMKYEYFIALLNYLTISGNCNMDILRNYKQYLKCHIIQMTSEVGKQGQVVWFTLESFLILNTFKSLQCNKTYLKESSISNILMKINKKGGFRVAGQIFKHLAYGRTLQPYKKP